VGGIEIEGQSIKVSFVENWLMSGMTSELEGGILVSTNDFEYLQPY
jgi:hypothetical protein